MAGGRRAPRQKLAGALSLLISIWTQACAQPQHVVAPGDTLFAIAARYESTVEQLRLINGLSTDLLRVGQMLALPARSPFHFESAFQGETLEEAASRLGLMTTSLSLANPELLPGKPLASTVRLRVPAVDGVSVQLAEGEDLLGLALAHGLAPAELLSVNGLSGLAGAAVGDWLLLPQTEEIPTASAPDWVPAVALAGETEQAVPEIFIAAGRARAEADVPGDRESAEAWHEAEQEAGLLLAARLLPTFQGASLDFIMPLQGRLSSGFGWRDISVGGNRFHGGIDIAVDAGTPVAAARDGLVVHAGWTGAYGYAVYLEHGEGLESRYAHLSAVGVGPGQIVRQGDQIGLAGSTGASTGPHLHFEIRMGGRAIDPLGLLHGPF